MTSTALYILGGALLLVFLVRRFTRHKETLDEYKEEQNKHIESVQASIRHDIESFEPHEALQPVSAGLRELAELHSDLLPFDLEKSTQDKLCLTTHSHPPRLIEILWIIRTAHLASHTSHKDNFLKGRGHWEVHEGEKVCTFYDLATLMKGLEETLHPGAACLSDSR